jgi:4-phosphopantoate---beta-alanine ligase
MERISSMKHEIPADHPRRDSIIIRERLIEGCRKQVVAPAGLIAQGRGEAFDYLFGEKTNEFAVAAVKAAAAAILLANHPVISVNGNVAALAPKETVELSKEANAQIEVNLFYRTPKRERAVASALRKAGADLILGVGKNASARIPELGSERRRVDPRGIEKADVVLVPLEDGDRTEALIHLGKTVITIDLNPLSRTAQAASITIVDNCTRAIPLLTDVIRTLRNQNREILKEILTSYDNKKTLVASLEFIGSRLTRLSSDAQRIDNERSQNNK